VKPPRTDEFETAARTRTIGSARSDPRTVGASDGSLRSWLFLFFFVSGACALVYQVVWLRLSMAAFGITTAMVAIVVSVFMAGLALGSWGAGRLTRRVEDPRRVLRLYAVAEIVIGAGGVLVARELEWARGGLDALGAGAAWASGAHYFGAGILVALALLPYCVAMGATFPLGMAALRSRQDDEGTSRAAGTFSYLYMANVIGAASGTLISALLMIELFGFHGTLQATAIINGLLGVAALALSARLSSGASAGHPQSAGRPSSAMSSTPNINAVSGMDAGLRWVPWLLFLTGLISMGMEVVWVRQFTPYLGTVVYAFASILAIYLVATFLGSALYRWHAARRQPTRRTAWGPGAVLAVALLAMLPAVLADPRFGPPDKFSAGLLRVALGIAPFCFTLGYLTPRLVDLWSRGDPGRAGSVYALNVLGCIAGPLVASFGLLPFLGERWVLALLALPLFAFVLAGSQARLLGTAALTAAAAVVFLSRDFDRIFPTRESRRDHSATVIAVGEGRNKHLLVNGYGMTTLTPITKMMVHLPLALRDRPPERVLVICFGMGTSFRSSLTWDVPTTAVELIPSVPELFDYYHPDAAAVRALPGAHIVVDDGRRYLERTREMFDVITVDPPPPVEAAGSSLLYSKEFFEAVRARLSPDGVLQQWLPPAEPIVVDAIARALEETFPHVRAFHSHLGWGIHFLASRSPISLQEPARLVARMPAAAQADLVEWEPGILPVDPIAAVLKNEISLDAMIGSGPATGPLTDDRPVNEYYLLRRGFKL
jgi:spermidine synthase